MHLPDLSEENAVSGRLIAQLTKIVGEKFLYSDEANRQQYARDETEDLMFLPDVVVKPADTQQVSQVMKHCFEHGIPVTPRGAGTGLSGGSLPVQKGVVLSMERFNRILDIDLRNLQATVEPGVVTQTFQEAVAEKGLFYPPDPASRGSCSLGGNLAHGSGGPRAVKYGVTRDYVLNLEVVLPSGEIIWTGANVLKNATGYNLTQLIVGSEGTLGIITKVVFKLLPYPTKNLVMLVPFASAEAACEAVARIFMAGIVPSCLEFMERDAIDKTIDYLGLPMVVPPHVQAHLLIEVDGNDMDALFKDAERIYEVLAPYETDEILLADTTEQKEILWQLRRKAAYAVRHTSVYKEEDTVVPRAELPKLLRGVKEIGHKYGFRSVCYGHVGDGNLHVNILKGDLSDYDWNHSVTEGIREIFHLVVSLGGTISGEHGIGLVQRPYIGIALGEVQLELMRGIKRVFDPKGILNPGKIF
ncbi:MAG: FAD-binding protein [Ferruginibacter sp.]|nr:FAD-binding protein [Cytophagales bacterium]